jgi:aminoglycoside/choline kinase family phosphotransferase
VIADRPELLTPDWLGEVLQRPVTGVAQQPIGTGQMCDSLRLTLDVDDDGPRTVVAKLPAADPTSRNTALALRSYEIEVRFYQQLAPDLPVRTPHVHHADIEVATASFVLLLEDLAPAEQGDQLAGCTLAEAQLAVDELVRLHAPRWDDPALAELDWLHRDPDGNRLFMLGLLPTLWEGFRERYAARLGPEVHEVGGQLFGRLEHFLSLDTAPWTVTHGDYRLDNLLFTGDRVAVVDWQTAVHGPALNDVAYFIGAGLLPDARPPHEDALVRRYHAGLVEAGVAGYDWDRCWRDYRRGTVAGLIMAIAASMLVEQTQRGDDMFMAMAHRHARHALDLDFALILDP